MPFSIRSLSLLVALSGLAGAQDAARNSPSEAALTFEQANVRAREPHRVSLRYAEIDTRADAPAVPLGLAAAERADNAASYWIVQLGERHGDADRQSLARAGLALLDYVPNHAWIVRGTRAQLAAARTQPAVAWSGPFHPAYRIAPELLTRPEADAGRFVVLAFPGVDAATLAAQVRAVGAAVELQDSSLGRWQVLASGSVGQMRALACANDVQWIQPESVPVERNDTMTWTVQTGVLNDRKIWTKGLHGEGQVIGHMDGSIALSSCFFFDPANPVGPSHRKVVYHSGTGTNSHGTHTAGTACGDAAPVNSATTARGLAYLAKLAHYTGYPSATFGSQAAIHGSYGARVHTNSWGDDASSVYDAFCAAVDTFLWNNEDHLVCFAITNLSRTVTHPDVAKNLLAVGSSGNGTASGGACFAGGYGPTLDGRRKPEIYTPGCSIVSAGTSSCGTTTMTGSSMACPSATAAAALVRQYFTDGFYPAGIPIPGLGFVPTGALVKAMLINSTLDMSGFAGYPSNTEGWGRLVLDTGLPFNGDPEQLFVVDVRRAEGLVTGKTFSYRLPVRSAAVPLRITLAFFDAPGTANASNPVVNNVDLVVIAPDSTTYVGNAIHTASGWSQPGGAADAINNVERVLIQAPAPGTWTIKVTGTSIPVARQGFALCATGAIDPNTTFAANLVYGSGKAGTNGTPRAAANSAPRVGNAEYAITLDQALGGASAVWLFGASQTAYPFDGAAILVTPLDALALVTTTSGTATIPLPVPDDPALTGAEFHSQFWVLGDPVAAGSHFACTQGLTTRVGN